jgi:hypothetical protein
MPAGLLVRSLQMEWTYLQHVIPGIEDAMALLMQAIQKFFLPALFEESKANLTPVRPLLGLKVGKAGLGVPDPHREQLHILKKIFSLSIKEIKRYK